MNYRVLSQQPDEEAPDGSEVRLLARGAHGSQAHFRLAPGEVSKAKQHRTVEELWFFVKGAGEMCVGDDVIPVGPGVSVHIPPRTRFQFVSHGPAPLDAVGTTMPPWPGTSDEAIDAPPYWTTYPTVE